MLVYDWMWWGHLTNQNLVQRDARRGAQRGVQRGAWRGVWRVCRGVCRGVHRGFTEGCAEGCMEGYMEGCTEGCAEGYVEGCTLAGNCYFMFMVKNKSSLYFHVLNQLTDFYKPILHTSITLQEEHSLLTGPQIVL